MTKGFEKWRRTLGDPVMATALLERLLHCCHSANIRGNSYRMQYHSSIDATPTFADYRCRDLEVRNSPGT
ncbi:MAG: hypothetical protein F4Y24_09580 [Gemmatimonadetes bacterium]|nr:hypothetical protein [Gemmatimonadota bacterium]MYG23686.1 hypothetical protein [Gemmatimonadota bacterium]MYJ39503.1 hypothetical protein [Gemmatimonadota bacterium]